VYLLVENRHATEIPTGPFRHIFLKLGIHRLEKGADEGSLPCWASNRTFLPDIGACGRLSSSLNGCLICKQLTLVVCDQDDKKGQGNLPAAEFCQSSEQSIYLRVSDNLSVLRVGQGRGEAPVRCRSHDVEIGAPFVRGPISGQVQGHQLGEIRLDLRTHKNQSVGETDVKQRRVAVEGEDEEEGYSQVVFLG